MCILLQSHVLLLRMVLFILFSQWLQNCTAHVWLPILLGIFIVLCHWTCLILSHTISMICDLSSSCIVSNVASCSWMPYILSHSVWVYRWGANTNHLIFHEGYAFERNFTSCIFVSLKKTSTEKNSELIELHLERTELQHWQPEGVNS